MANTHVPVSLHPSHSQFSEPKNDFQMEMGRSLEHFEECQGYELGNLGLASRGEQRGQPRVSARWSQCRGLKAPRSGWPVLTASLSALHHLERADCLLHSRSPRDTCCRQLPCVITNLCSSVVRNGIDMGSFWALWEQLKGSSWWWEEELPWQNSLLNTTRPEQSGTDLHTHQDRP